MKKITLLFLLTIAPLCYAQSNVDQMMRSRDVIYSVEHTMKHSDTIKTPDTAFAFNKINTLKLAKIDFTKQQNANLTELFRKQYQPLADAYSKFKEGRTPKTRLDLYSLFVKNEEDFRAVLTPEQMLTYLRYHDKHNGMMDMDFRGEFMDDKALATYKKEIK